MEKWTRVQGLPKREVKAPTVLTECGCMGVGVGPKIEVDKAEWKLESSTARRSITVKAIPSDPKVKLPEDLKAFAIQVSNKFSASVNGSSGMYGSPYWMPSVEVDAATLEWKKENGGVTVSFDVTMDLSRSQLHVEETLQSVVYELMSKGV